MLLAKKEQLTKVVPRPTALDKAYTAQRRGLATAVANGVAMAWIARKEGDDQSFLKPAIQLVEGGMRHTVSMVDAYFTHKANLAAGRIIHGVKGMSDHDSTIQALRGVPAEEVYSRVFGKFFFQLGDGVPQAQAEEAARKYAYKLASTDMQLAQTHAAKEWIRMHNAGR